MALTQHEDGSITDEKGNEVKPAPDADDSAEGEETTPKKRGRKRANADESTEEE